MDLFRFDNESSLWNAPLVNDVTGFQLIDTFDAPNNFYLEGILHVKTNYLRFIN